MTLSVSRNVGARAVHRTKRLITRHWFRQQRVEHFILVGLVRDVSHRLENPPAGNDRLLRLGAELRIGRELRAEGTESFFGTKSGSIGRILAGANAIFSRRYLVATGKRIRDLPVAGHDLSWS